MSTAGNALPALESEDVAALVRAALDRPNATVTDVAVEACSEPVTNLMTASLMRVGGLLADDRGSTHWSLFVKTLQSAIHSPAFAQIPAEFHAQALAQFPWRAEGRVYRSSLARHLPAGLRMPAIHRVIDLDDTHMSIWMEDVPLLEADWDLDRYRRAARLLGRMAGRLPERRLPADVLAERKDLREYFFGRVTHAVLPALRDPATWNHPLLREAVDDRLHDDLPALAEAVPPLLDRLDELPRTLVHGDACPQNLLTATGEPDTLVAIDWTFVGVCAIGFDLGQLLAGRAESGDLDPAALASVHDAIFPEYVAGLRDENCAIDEDRVRLGYLGALLIRSGITSLPTELLAGVDTPELRRLFARRAHYARFLVDLGLDLARSLPSHT